MSEGLKPVTAILVMGATPSYVTTDPAELGGRQAMLVDYYDSYTMKKFFLDNNLDLTEADAARVTGEKLGGYIPEGGKDKYGSIEFAKIGFDDKGQFSRDLELIHLIGAAQKIVGVIKDFDPYHHALFSSYLEEMKPRDVNGRRIAKVDIALDIDMEDYTDRGSTHEMLKGCSARQIAQYKPQASPFAVEYEIKQEYWDMFDPMSKIGLLLHEVIYRVARELYDHRNSESPRIFNHLLASGAISKFAPTEIEKESEFAGFTFSKKYFDLISLLDLGAGLEDGIDSKPTVSMAVILNGLLTDLATQEKLDSNRIRFLSILPNNSSLKLLVNHGFLKVFGQSKVLPDGTPILPLIPFHGSNFVLSTLEYDSDVYNISSLVELDYQKLEKGKQYDPGDSDYIGVKSEFFSKKISEYLKSEVSIAENGSFITVTLKAESQNLSQECQNAVVEWANHLFSSERKPINYKAKSFSVKATDDLLSRFECEVTVRRTSN